VCTNFNLRDSKSEGRELRRKVTRLEKALFLAKQVPADTESELCRLQQDLSAAVALNIEHKNSIDYLHNLRVDESLSDNSLFLFNTSKNHYKTETELCVMKLLNENVDVAHVPKVIKIVAELCGKTNIDGVPSERRVRDVNHQKLSTSYRQIENTLQKEENTTLQSGETGKRGDTYMGYHLREHSGKNWVIGLREMSDKSAETTIDTLKEI
jgi:hypothetical protein